MSTIAHNSRTARTTPHILPDEFDDLKAAVIQANPKACSFLPVGIMGAPRVQGIVWQATGDPRGQWGWWVRGMPVTSHRAAPSWHEAQQSVWARIREQEGITRGNRD